MATIAKASEHIKPCNIAQCERHNRRDEDYIKSLDPARIYVRLELTHNNEIYIAPGMEGVTLQQHYDYLKALVKEKTGRAMQEKDVEYKDKNGKTRVRKGSMRNGASEPSRYTCTEMKGIMRIERTNRHGNQTSMRISSGTG